MPATDVIRKDDVIDLTAKMQPDGTLNWTPPEGNWLILRFGYSLLGTTNHPASPEGTGLEVDKLNPDDVRDYFITYLDNYKDAVGPDLMGKRGLRYVINDSWEAGAQNWTDNMIAEFTANEPVEYGGPAQRRSQGFEVAHPRRDCPISRGVQAVLREPRDQ